MPSVSGFDQFRQLKQFGTDCEAGAPGGVGIDLEPDFVSFQDEVDDPAAFGKAFASAERSYFFQKIPAAPAIRATARTTNVACGQTLMRSIRTNLLLSISFLIKSLQYQYRTIISGR